MPSLPSLSFRIGIDVGGTFTHAVAIDTRFQSSGQLGISGKVKVQTTHSSPNGVGDGIVQALKLLMEQCQILPQQISIIAHSTTQATNSLLEGDVEKVVILSTGRGAQGLLARKAAQQGKIPVSPGKYLETFSHHYDPTNPKAEKGLSRFLTLMRSQGVRVAIAASPFSVDQPEAELALAEYARSHGFMATATHEVSQLYGIKVRVRTTTINASILPKMMEVAQATEREIRRLGIHAPLMIMRSDGGIMTVEEMRKKPILTLLSGPAAGIAAALRYLQISDGIFLEVGGTSTDISVIRNGRAITRSASIGGMKTYLKTLDCRTLGIGGGSLPKIRGCELIDMGPRSAHIAGVKYAAFAPLSREQRVSPARLKEQNDKDSDYLYFDANEFGRFGFTPTCAANALGWVKDGDPAQASENFPGQWDSILRSAGLGSLPDFSENVLRIATSKLIPTVEGLLREYGLERSWTTLVGGGGGASALVPYLAHRMKMKFEIARDSEVISAIGVALGMVRQTIEKSCIDPKPEDIYRVREEARESVLAQGADPGSIEVFLEVDHQRNRLTASAQGSIQFTNQALQEPHPHQNPLSIPDHDLLQLAEKALGFLPSDDGSESKPTLAARASSTKLTVAQVKSSKKSLFGLTRGETHHAVVVDPRGVVRLKLPEAEILASVAGTLIRDLKSSLEKKAVFGDGGVSYPFLYCLIGDRVVDLSKLTGPETLASVLEVETKEIPPGEPTVLLFTHRGIEE